MKDTVTKTVWQHSESLPQDTMEFLKGIAKDYCKVRNYVYGKYSGVKSLGRLTPVYSVLNEMRHCGLREQLNLPSVYYELAIADAVTDIKCSWEITKNKINEKITANEGLSTEDRLYLRTVLKMGNIYASILNYQEYEMPRKAVGLDIDTNRLNNLLRRLTRRTLAIPETEGEDWFKVSPNGYSYRDGAICVVSRTPRKRVSIPLKDGRIFDRQIRVGIRKDSVILAIPVETEIKKHWDYTNSLYVYIGDRDMFTLSNGNIYGEGLGELINPETERLAGKNRERRRMYEAYKQCAKDGDLQKAGNIETNNLGKLKYNKQKKKEKSRTETFINSEINRMLKTEKPARIVITRPVVKNRTKIYSKTANRKAARSFRGFIRGRLAYKCRVNSIELVEINSKGTGNKCSACGGDGIRQGKEFLCGRCGMQTTIALNSAKNIEHKYVG